MAANNRKDVNYPRMQRAAIRKVVHWCRADQQQAQRSPSGKPEMFSPLINSMFLLAIQEGLSKTWDTHGCQVQTNSNTAGALFYTAFSLKYAPSCILTASLEQETLVNLFIST